jgi:hypothetical protein
VKDFVTSENGDIKFNKFNDNINLKKNHSEKSLELVSNRRNVSDRIVDERKTSSTIATSLNVSQHVDDSVNSNLKHSNKVDDQTKKNIAKKSKYQDFDQSLVPDDGILTSIMKAFGLHNQCPVTPPDLNGPVEVDTSPDYMENVESHLTTKVQIGGRYKPNECNARDKVAIVVPYRDRKQHLPIFLKNLHPFLMKQQIDYGIFVVEQSSDGSFNRAKLFNIGFVEALKLYDWDCFIFHDVDLLPMDDRNLYSCPTQPRHMSVAVDTFGFKYDD